MYATSPVTPNIHKKEEDNKTNCEHIHCKLKATEKVKVDAGIYGFIELSVCNACKKIFDNQNKHTANLGAKTTREME